jgi:hypothetical protein
MKNSEIELNQLKRLMIIISFIANKFLTCVCKCICSNEASKILSIETHYNKIIDAIGQSHDDEISKIKKVCHTFSII